MYIGTTPFEPVDVGQQLNTRFAYPEMPWVKYFWYWKEADLIELNISSMQFQNQITIRLTFDYFFLIISL
jgi:hypothetical protein